MKMRVRTSFLICLFPSIIAAGLITASCGPAAPADDTGEKLAARLAGLWFLTNDVRTVTNATATNTYSESGGDRFYWDFRSDRSCHLILITNDVTNTNQYTYSVDNSSNLSLVQTLPATNILIDMFGFYFEYDIQAYRFTQRRRIESVESASWRAVGIERGTLSMSGSIRVYTNTNTAPLMSESFNSNITTNLNDSAADFSLYLKK